MQQDLALKRLIGKISKAGGQAIMRDNHYRKLCSFEADYDRCIDAIKQVNSYCSARAAADREESACNAVHSVISAVLFGDAGTFATTGGAMATRASSDPKRPDYMKVILSVRPA